jgi:hypothetical protein
MLKTTATLLGASGLFLVSTLIAAPEPTPVPIARVPEPGAVPELVLCLAAVGAGYWLLRRKWKATE